MKSKDLQPITKQFVTYNTRQDPFNADQRFLAKGSMNVLIDNIEKVGSRKGYTLQSLAGVDQPAKGSTEWENSTGDNFPLKSYLLTDGSSGLLTFLINGNWETLMDSLTSVNLIFDPYWDDTEKIDRLLWCDGSTNLYDWSGGTAILSSISAGTVTLQGTKTFGQKRFLTTNTRAIRIKDDNGVWHRTAYTGGESTTTLTGLDTDLTGFPFTGGNNLIVQEVIIRANQPDSGFKTDFIKVIENQVLAGSRTSNKIYLSKTTSVTDYTFSTPRAVGEGALFTLDGPGRAVESLRGDIIMFAGESLIYKTQFQQITVGVDLAETIKVVRLKTTSRQSAIHQNLLANIGNGLVWIGNDNVLYEMTDATLAYNPDLRAISDTVKPNFDATDFTGGHLLFNNPRLYISAPASAVDYIYEFRLVSQTSLAAAIGNNDGSLSREWFWQPPMNIPASRWAIIDSVIHAHSSATNETYKLFDGYNDNGQAIHSVMVLARWNGGVREQVKNLTELFNEGSISGNTKIGVQYSFDKDGGEQENVNKIIDSAYENMLFSMMQDPSLGNNPLGDLSLSGDVDNSDNIMHFRVIDDINVQEFFDYSVKFETNDVDYRWEIMCHGSDSVLATSQPTAIKNNN